MSEYQYYEFRTDGRKLDSSARKTLEKLSSRAIVTSNQAIYTYPYSDFRYDCREILADYFDIMLYLNNYGTRQLMIRLPIELVEQSKIDLFCIKDIISYSIQGESLILDWCINDEDGGSWIEGEGWLDDLMSIRQELLSGDLRGLYLAWLAAIQYCHVEEDHLEPSVPHNLKQLSFGQEALVSYFELNTDLIQVAAEASKELDTQNIDINVLISQLSEEEKNMFLIGFLQNTPDLSIKLKRRLQGFITRDEKVIFRSNRTIAQLRHQLDEVTKLRQEKMEKEKRETRIKQLERLANNEFSIWQEITNSIESKTQAGYKNATKLLNDLRELASYKGKEELFENKMIQINKKYSRLSAFMRRLRESELEKDNY